MSLQEAYQEFEEQERPDGPIHYFGQVLVDIYDGVLVKGAGIMPYDPGVDTAARKVKVSKVTVKPLKKDGEFADYEIERRLVPFDNGWAKIIKPSLARLGVSLPMINGAWAHIQMTPEGRKYTNRNGEEKESTTIEFLGFFDTKELAQTAADAHFSEFNGGNGSLTDSPTTYAPNGQSGSNSERDVAQRFLPVLGTQAKGDPAELAKLIAANPIVSKYFSINSPEVISLLTGVQPTQPKMAEIPF